MAGFLGVITRLRNPLLASLRDSPKPRPDLHLLVQCSAGKNMGLGFMKSDKSCLTQRRKVRKEKLGWGLLETRNYS